MQINKLKRIETFSPSQLSHIVSFEKKYDILIPQEYKNLLIQTNGLRMADDDNLHFNIKDNETNCVYEFNRRYIF